jgi:hypothetical protein
MKGIFCYCIMSLLAIAGCATPQSKLALAVVADRHSDPRTVEMAIQHLGRVRESPSFWASIGNDDSYTIERRRICIMQLFRRHVRTGMSLGTVAEELQRPNWMPDASFRRVGAFTGSSPVKIDYADSSLFQIYVLPPARAGVHTSEIFLSISGHLTKEEFGQVIRGEAVDERIRGAKLKELGFFER